MIREILEDVEERMKKTVEIFRKDLASTRAGRASPSLLDKVSVDYYGEMLPVTQVATISVPEPRLLVIQVWDHNAVNSIEKAIQKSELGMPPQKDGNIIRLVVPQLTEERRLELVKVCRKKAEDEKVAIRNLRRDANDMLKDLEKEREVSEDEARRALDEVQKLTDKYIQAIEGVLKIKEEEIMEV
ncbi:MAG: ribosome recycling factor [Bacillota bacterium]